MYGERIRLESNLSNVNRAFGKFKENIITLCRKRDTDIDDLIEKDKKKRLKILEEKSSLQYKVFRLNILNYNHEIINAINLKIDSFFFIYCDFGENLKKGDVVTNLEAKVKYLEEISIIGTFNIYLKNEVSSFYKIEKNQKVKLSMKKLDIYNPKNNFFLGLYLTDFIISGLSLQTKDLCLFMNSLKGLKSITNLEFENLTGQGLKTNKYKIMTYKYDNISSINFKSNSKNILNLNRIFLFELPKNIKNFSIYFIFSKKEQKYFLTWLYKIKNSETIFNFSLKDNKNLQGYFNKIQDL